MSEDELKAILIDGQDRLSYEIKDVILLDSVYPEYQLVFAEFGTMFLEIRIKGLMASLDGRYISRKGKTLTDRKVILLKKNVPKMIYDFIIDLRVGGDLL